MKLHSQLSEEGESSYAEAIPFAQQYSEDQLHQAAVILCIPVQHLTDRLNSESHVPVPDVSSSMTFTRTELDNGASGLFLEQQSNHASTNVQQDKDCHHPTLGLSNWMDPLLPDQQVPSEWILDTFDCNNQIQTGACPNLPDDSLVNSRNLTTTTNNQSYNGAALDATQPFTLFASHTTAENQVPSQSANAHEHSRDIIPAQLTEGPIYTQNSMVNTPPPGANLGPLTRVWEVPKRRRARKLKPLGSTPLAQQRSSFGNAGQIRRRRGPFIDNAGCNEGVWKTLDLVDISDWASDERKTIELSPVLMDGSYSVKYKVREFKPVEGDMLEETWTSNGEPHSHKIPPYAIENMEEAASHLRESLDRGIYAYVKTFGWRSNPLLIATYEMAIKQAFNANTIEERRLLMDTLRFWVVCRETSNVARIVNEEQFGILKVDDPQSPWFAYVPIPPILIAQFQCIIYTKFLQPLSRDLLNRLNTMVLSNKRRYWFTLYLVIFVLLHSCSLSTRRNEEFARQISLPVRFANPHAIRAHHNGATILLAHFHFINKGARPFSLLQTKKTLESFAAAAELDQSQMDFLKETSLQVNSQSTAMLDARNALAVGNDLYWISQLYVDDWKPPPTVV
ncbi:hypothetical protein PG991_006339 [Apiospora marii]|uniref:Uncharacterized protein n=1 Tax=Apiospora marii TaxID=335849 RepID=A0ABR1SBX0_9PEZI